VYLLKDTAAACVAELVAGRGRNVKSFLYVFIDTFIGGGLVIDSQWRGGVHGNAGAIGSMALGLADASGAPAQLLSVASLVKLERAYAGAALDPSAALDARALEAPWSAHTRAWVGQAAAAIGLAVHHAACLLDIGLGPCGLHGARCLAYRFGGNADSDSAAFHHGDDMRLGLHNYRPSVLHSGRRDAALLGQILHRVELLGVEFV